MSQNVRSAFDTYKEKITHNKLHRRRSLQERTTREQEVGETGKKLGDVASKIVTDVLIHYMM